MENVKIDTIESIRERLIFSNDFEKKTETTNVRFGVTEHSYMLNLSRSKGFDSLVEYTRWLLRRELGLLKLEITNHILLLQGYNYEKPTKSSTKTGDVEIEKEQFESKEAPLRQKGLTNSQNREGD